MHWNAKPKRICHSGSWQICTLIMAKQSIAGKPQKFGVKWTPVWCQDKLRRDPRPKGLKTWLERQSGELALFVDSPHFERHQWRSQLGFSRGASNFQLAMFFDCFQLLWIRNLSSWGKEGKPWVTQISCRSHDNFLHGDKGWQQSKLLHNVHQALSSCCRPFDSLTTTNEKGQKSRTSGQLFRAGPSHFVKEQMLLKTRRLEEMCLKSSFPTNQQEHHSRDVKRSLCQG